MRMRDSSGNVLFLFFGLILGIIAFAVFEMLQRDTTLIILTDSSNCIPTEYSIILQEKTISASSSEGNIVSDKVMGKYEQYFTFTAHTNKNGEFEYSVVANYEGCESVEGPMNTVKFGSVIYEHIFDGKVIHDIRSK